MLASGSGTILQALLDSGLSVDVVVVDRTCAATDRAGAAGVPVEFVARESFGRDFDRLAYTHRVVDALRRHDVDLVAMAGFMTILDKPMQDEFGFGEIEARGLFERTDRNLFDGQDLDVPTYLRKGIKIAI